MDLYNFLPKYPEIENKDLNSYEGEDFNQVIYNKKEFNDLKLDRFENIKKGKLLKHQKIISRFISSYTPYDGLLLFHYMGTGKTCSSIGTIEKILNEKKTPFKKVLILCRGKSIINNWITEICYKCTNGKYIPENFDNIKSWNKKRLILKKILKKNYEFYTFYNFVKKIKHFSPDMLNQLYNNCIIVIDEVHNIRIQNKEYKPIHKFLHSIYNKKVLLLSGTPMKDLPEEIATIMNLILPLNLQLPIKQHFINKFLNIENKIFSIKEEEKQELKKYFTGRVSYLNFFVDNVDKQYIGQSIGKLKYMKVYVDYMSEYQSNIYLEKFNAENKGTEIENDINNKLVKKKKIKMNWYSGSRQSALFVFPDSSYGSKGFNKYIKSNKKQVVDFNNKKQVYYTYSLNSELKKEFKNCKNNNDKLDIIKKYSSKYYTIIKSILENKKKKILIFSEFVKGSGIILLSKLLEEFNFKNSNGNEKTDHERYMILTNSTTTPSKLKKLINRFNNIDNIFGEKIRIVFGSKIISEGISLFNIQNVHIVTGHWNYSITEQTISRAIRADSHYHLLNHIDNVNINIYLHVSIPKNEEKQELLTKSIDLKLYEISEHKDISIKNIEYFIKLNSFDCSLNYIRNSQYKKDYSRNCEYKLCDYKCEDVNLFNNNLDKSTYELYYNYNIINNIKNRIIKLFEIYISIEFDYICNNLKEYTQNDILYALKLLIDNSIPIYNKYGFISYLKEYNNTYFIINNINTGDNILSVYYTQNPIVNINKNFMKMSNDLYIDHFNNTLLPKLLKDEDNDIINIISYDIQEIILESCILSNILKKQNHQKFVEKILNKYQHYINYIDQNIIISTFLHQYNGILRCLNLNTKKWTNCDENLYIEYFEMVQTKKDKFKSNNNIPYYGRFYKKQFLIVDNVDKDIVNNDDKRVQRTGKACKSWKKQDLIVIIYNLNINKLYEKFKKNKLSKSKQKIYENNRNNKRIMKEKISYSNIYDFIKKEINDKISDVWKDIEKTKKLYLLCLATKITMCNIIEEYFKNNNLIDYTI